MSEKKILLFLLTIFTFLSCEKQVSQSDFQVEPEKMVIVLADVHIAEIAMQGMASERKDSMAQVYYSQIFEMHGVEEETFNHDLDIIRSNPKILKEYYTKVMELLNKKEVKKNK